MLTSLLLAGGMVTFIGTTSLLFWASQVGGYGYALDPNPLACAPTNPDEPSTPPHS